MHWYQMRTSWSAFSISIVRNTFDASPKTWSCEEDALNPFSKKYSEASLEYNEPSSAPDSKVIILLELMATCPSPSWCLVRSNSTILAIS